MSTFDNYEKDDLYNEIMNFLQNHPVSELLKIVSYAIEYREGEEE